MPPGTRYATFGTPMGIILISFLMEDRRDPLLVIPMPLGAGDTMPFFGTNVDTAIAGEDEGAGEHRGRIRLGAGAGGHVEPSSVAACKAPRSDK